MRSDVSLSVRGTVAKSYVTVLRSYNVVPRHIGISVVALGRTVGHPGSEGSPPLHKPHESSQVHICCGRRREGATQSHAQSTVVLRDLARRVLSGPC